MHSARERSSSSRWLFYLISPLVPEESRSLRSCANPTKFRETRNSARCREHICAHTPRCKLSGWHSFAVRSPRITLTYRLVIPATSSFAHLFFADKARSIGSCGSQEQRGEGRTIEGRRIALKRLFRGRVHVLEAKIRVACSLSLHARRRRARKREKERK